MDEDNKVVRLPTGKDRKTAGRKTKHRSPNIKPVGSASSLTSKQEQFAWLIVMEDKNQTEAYRAAYDCENMLPQTIWSLASNMMKHPKVSARMEELRRRKEERDHHDGAHVRRKLMEKLLFLADNAAKDSDKLKALEMLGKFAHVQAFSDKLEVKTSNVEMSSEEIMAEIQRRLQDLAG